MIFVTLSLILKNFSLGQVGMPKFDVLVLLSLYTHVISNSLNLKYIRCAVMAEWLTNLTKDVGSTRFESLRIPVINFPPLDVNVYLGVFLPATFTGLRTREQQGIRSFTVFIKLTTK